MAKARPFARSGHAPPTKVLQISVTDLDLATTRQTSINRRARIQRGCSGSRSKVSLTCPQAVGHVDDTRFRLRELYARGEAGCLRYLEGMYGPRPNRYGGGYDRWLPPMGIRHPIVAGRSSRVRRDARAGPDHQVPRQCLLPRKNGVERLRPTRIKDKSSMLADPTPPSRREPSRD